MRGYGIPGETDGRRAEAQVKASVRRPSSSARPEDTVGVSSQVSLEHKGGRLGNMALVCLFSFCVRMQGGLQKQRLELERGA